MVVEEEDPDTHGTILPVRGLANPNAAYRAVAATVSTLAAVPYHRIDNPEKLRRLMAAILMVSADIELTELLRHFIAEACSLVEARYGALGVLNAARTTLDQFLTVGLTDEEEQRIGPAPDRTRRTRCPDHRS